MKTLKSLARKTAAAAAIIFAASLMTALPANAAPAGVASAGLPQISPDEAILLQSGAPVSVTVDAGTGSVLAVTEAPVQTNSVTTNNCSLGKACWFARLSPGAFYGFTPGGTNSGSWADRGRFDTGNYTARPCWSTTPSGGVICAGGFAGPHSVFNLDAGVTGRRVEFG